MVSANTLDRQTRATKVIRSLTNSDYKVEYVCWDRGLKTPRSEKKEAGNAFIERKFNLTSSFGNKSIFLIPFWWCYAFLYLMSNKWDIAHICGFHSVPPVLLAGKLKNKSVVYEMIDTFADTMILPIFLRTILIDMDKIFMYISDAIILADQGQVQEVNGIPNERVIIVYDSPSTISNINIYPKKDEIFTIFYAGLLLHEKKLNLDKMFFAIEDIPDIKLVIAGFGNLVNIIQEWTRKYPNKISFIGEISHSEVLERSARADLLFVLRSEAILENKYICGSKVLEAMMCGTPILVNKDTSTD